MRKMNDTRSHVAQIPPLSPDAPQLWHHIISRPRLLDRLNDGMKVRLTLLSTAPGWGRTTLLREWVRHSPIPAVMLSLNHNHNEPQRLVDGLDRAITPLMLGSNPTERARIGELWADQLVTFVINRMATIPFDFALVLDNVHLIDALAARNVLSELVEYLPPRAHLVISTREAPELPLPRMRVRRQCVELRDEDLGFTSEETTVFIREIRKLIIPQGQIDLLHNRTEGWATGIRLAAKEIEECSECRQGSSSRIISGNDPQIESWFDREILQRQPSDVAEFLLRTSTLDELTGQGCDAVTGRTDGRRMLDQLERRNLFLRPLDDDRGRYRYHMLFREFLRQRLRRTHRPPLSAFDGRAIHP